MNLRDITLASSAAIAVIAFLSGCGGGSAQPAATVTQTVTAPAGDDLETFAPQDESTQAASPTTSDEPDTEVASEGDFWVWSADEIEQIGPDLWVYGDPSANTSLQTADSLLPVMQLDMDYKCKAEVTSSDMVPDMIHCGGEGVIACFETPDEAFQHARELVGFGDGLDARIVVGNCNMTLPESNTSAVILERLDQTAYLMPFLVSNQDLR